MADTNTKPDEIAKSRVDEIQALYENESPRSKILIIGSALDEAVKKLLQIFLVSARSEDDLLDQYRPVGEFKVRIELAERLGLISAQLAANLHIVRRLRNDCAHTLESFNFESGSTSDRIDQLYQDLGLATKEFFYPKSTPSTQEEKFELTTSLYMYYLEGLTGNMKSLKQGHLELLLYDDELEDEKPKPKSTPVKSIKPQ